MKNLITCNSAENIVLKVEHLIDFQQDQKRKKKYEKCPDFV